MALVLGQSDIETHRALRSIASELAEHRMEWKSQHDRMNHEVLDLTAVIESRATYYDPLNSESCDSKSFPTLAINPTGMTTKSANLTVQGVRGKMRQRQHKGVSKEEERVPLVVLVAGSGATQAWPSLLMIDSARIPPVAPTCETPKQLFDLVLLVRTGDNSPVIPCVSSQGCRPEGVGLSPSGLRIVHGSPASTSGSGSDDKLAAEALKLFDKTKHSSFLVVSASAVLPPRALWTLVNSVECEHDDRDSCVDVAVPVVHGLFDMENAPNSLEKLYAVKGGLQFAAHPLNAARVQAAIELLPPRAIQRSDIFHEKDSLCAISLSSRSVSKLKDPDVELSLGLLPALRLLSRKPPPEISSYLHHYVAPGHHYLVTGVQPMAFSYWNRAYLNVVESFPASMAQSPPEMGKSSTLLAICAAGVPDKTVSALVALEASLATSEAAPNCGSGQHFPFTCSAFDLVVGVSPYPGDRTSSFLEAAGVFVLRQPAPLGLSDLWNRLVQFAFFEHKYAHLILSNNDVLIPPGTVGATAALLNLRPRSVATVLSQKGGGTAELGNSLGTPLFGAEPDVVAFSEHAFNYKTVQSQMSRAAIVSDKDVLCSEKEGLGDASCSSTNSPVNIPVVARTAFVGFFWGMSSDLAKSLILPDGTGRLLNTTARLNFGQEKEILDRLQKLPQKLKPAGPAVMVGTAAYVHHFRGQTLGGCQNGHRNCAQWQVGHHADASFHINGYAPIASKPRPPPPWWEPAFGNMPPQEWKETAGRRT